MSLLVPESIEKEDYRECMNPVLAETFKERYSHPEITADNAPPPCLLPLASCNIMEVSIWFT